MHTYKYYLLAFVGLIVSGCSTGLATGANPETVLVAGATGRTGSAIRVELKENGYDVIALTRNVESARRRHGVDWTWVEADVKDSDALSAAMKGADYVISAIGARDRDGPDGPEFVDYGGVRNLVEAAQRNGVKHFVLISSAAAGIHRKKSQMVQIGNIRYWKTMGENAVKRSGLPYTVIGPGGLEDEPETDSGLRILTRQDYTTGLIAIGDIAMLAVAALRDPNAKNKTFAAIRDNALSRQTWPLQLEAIPVDSLTEEGRLEDPPAVSQSSQ